MGEALDSWPAFVDTAAVLTNLDLLITSDTAIAHLAGAMGVETWLAQVKFPIGAGGSREQKRFGMRTCGCSVRENLETGLQFSST